MTRPIKKARVTRRRKYYGGGKKRGGTTLKKVGGGNKTRQIKRCRGSKKGGGTKRKVGGRVKSFVKKQGGGFEIFESYLRLPVNSIIEQDQDAVQCGIQLGLHDGDTGQEARDVLKDIIDPVSSHTDELKKDIKLLWPIIRSRVATITAEDKNTTFNNFINNFITDLLSEKKNLTNIIKVLTEWGLTKDENREVNLVQDNMSRNKILESNNLDFFRTHYNLDKIFFACFWEYKDVKEDDKQFISLIEKAPTIIKSRIEFFESLLSDKFGHLYTIQEDDFFSHLNPTSVEVMRDSSGLYGTIKIKEKNLGFIRQIKEVKKIEKIGEEFITTNIRSKKKVKSSNTFQMVASLQGLGNLVNFNNDDKKKWKDEIDELISSFNNDEFKIFEDIKKNPSGQTDKQFIYKLSDGVTIYYDTAKFTLKQNLSKCGNNTNNDPYVLAAFSTNDSSSPDIPDFYVLTTHLESGRKNAKNELQRITGLNEILEEFENLITKNGLPSNIPLIIGMDANTPVYKHFYCKKNYYTAATPKRRQAGILLDSLEFVSKNKWLVSGEKPKDEPKEIDLTFLDGKPEWLVSKPKPDDGAIQPTTDTTETVISVNKNRGFGTAQAWKMAADEYHLIDWLCIVNNKNSPDPDNANSGNMSQSSKIITKKLAILPTRKDMTNDLENMLPTGYNDGSLSPEIEPSNIIENIQNGCFGENNHYYSWFSDHLPLVAGLECNGTGFNIVQNNVLSLWLGFDGFKGPNRPPDAQPPAPAPVKPAPEEPVESATEESASEESASEEPAEPATEDPAADESTVKPDNENNQF